MQRRYFQILMFSPFEIRQNAKLTVGNHLLEGKLISLEKPLAIVQKKRTDDGVYYEIIGLCKKKLQFKARPKPVTRHPPVLS